VGFEKMEKGSLGALKYPDRAVPIDKHIIRMDEISTFVYQKPFAP